MEDEDTAPEVLDERTPGRGEVWRHRKFGHFVRVLSLRDDLVSFHSLKVEEDRKFRRFSSERRVRPGDFRRIFQYDAGDQSDEAQQQQQ